jgi:hypothetical protein
VFIIISHVSLLRLTPEWILLQNTLNHFPKYCLSVPTFPATIVNPSPWCAVCLSYFKFATISIYDASPLVLGSSLLLSFISLSLSSFLGYQGPLLTNQSSVCFQLWLHHNRCPIYYFWISCSYMELVFQDFSYLQAPAWDDSCNFPLSLFVLTFLTLLNSSLIPYSWNLPRSLRLEPSTYPAIKCSTKYHNHSHSPNFSPIQLGRAWCTICHILTVKQKAWWIVDIQ